MITTFFDRIVFPFFDQFPKLTCVSMVVRSATGYWIHPGSWVVLAGLMVVLAVLWIKRHPPTIPV